MLQSRRYIIDKITFMQFLSRQKKASSIITYYVCVNITLTRVNLLKHDNK